MSIKCSLIIDGNGLMYKDVFILKKTRTIGQDLLTLMNKDFERMSGIYPFDNIYFVSDFGKSWRKQDYQEYKGNRKKDDSIDWDQVYKDYDTFKEGLSQKSGVQMIQVNGLEGDDIIGYAVKESNKKGYSTVIVAADSDLQQLLEFSKSKNYINMMWNYKFSDERVYFPRNYELFMKEVEDNLDEGFDLFDLNYDSEFLQMLDTLINRAKLKEVVPEEVLFQKLLQGDKKDNIPSVIKLKDREINEEKGQGIGEAGALKCYKLYKDTYGDDSIDFKSDEFINNATEIAAFYKKVPSRPELKEVIKENLKFNYHMLNLDSTEIPKNLLTELKNNIII
jgi:5'-3' exonuclease